MKDLQKSSVWLHTHLAGRAVTFVPVLVCDKELVSIIYIKVKCVCVCVCMWLSYVIPPTTEKAEESECEQRACGQGARTTRQVG